MQKKHLYILLVFVLLTEVALIKNYGNIPFFYNIAGKGNLSYTTKSGIEYNNISPDVFAYINAVEYFRGNTDTTALIKPFAYRVLPIYLASLLPDSLEPDFALDIINLIFLYIGLFYLFRLLTKLEFPDKLVITGLLIYTVSFPVFYYGMACLTDSVAFGLMFPILYYSESNKRFLVILLLALAGLTKDTLIILTPVLAFIDYGKTLNLGKSIRNGLLYFAVFFIFWTLPKYLMPTGSAFYWHFALSTLRDNLVRPRLYISSLLSFGLPGILAICYIIKNYTFILKKRNDLGYLTGVLAGIALWIYSLLTAYTDGRFFWYIYPFGIVLGLKFINESPHFKHLLVQTNSINN